MIPITLNYASGVPIYVQLKESLKNAIVIGTYPPGMQLPTVRQMAVTLKINANTVSRAYTELEREGVLTSQQGRGTFVTFSKNINYKKMAELEQLVLNLLKDAQQMGFSKNDVHAMLETINHTHPDLE